MAGSFGLTLIYAIIVFSSVVTAQLSSYALPTDISGLSTVAASTSTTSSITTSSVSTSSKGDTGTSTSTGPSQQTTVDLSTFYCQKTRDPKVHCLTPSQLLEADLAALCPSGNCLKDCQTQRVFEVLPEGVNVAYDQYGTLNSTRAEITLFGICVDIANVTRALASGGVPAEQAQQLKPYFPNNDSGLTKIADSITQCLPASCAKSRDSSTCAPWCRESDLLSVDGTTNLTAVATCLEWLCEESCGLPYANQDVVGIGVTISYVMQGILVILCWFASLGSSIYNYFSPEEEHEWKEIFLESASGFLLFQNYFGIPLAIAALTLNPFEIDPLNGYGLLSVSICGFLPQIFTLMILNAHGKRSWYLSILTCITWLLASIVFWALHANLMGNAAVQDSSYRSLYNIDSCGGSGATALCLQTTGASPLAFLQDYYYHSIMPGINTVPIIWAWCSFVLCVLMVSQCLHNTPVPGQDSFQSPRPAPGSIHKKVWDIIATAASSTPAYLTASLLFFLAIAYQAAMFATYIPQFIDSHNWAFGQVIAITLWIPPLLDYAHAEYKHTREKREKTPSHGSSAAPPKHQRLASVSTTHSTAHAPRPSSIAVPATQYQPLPSPYQRSPDPSADFGFEQQAGYEAGDDAPASGAQRRHDQFELRSRPTLRMEEGQEQGQGQGQRGAEPVRRKPVGSSVR